MNAFVGEMQKAGSLNAIKESKSLSVTLNGKPVAVFYIKGELYATSGKCPHAGGPIHCSEVEGYSLTCPWHGFSFDAKSGICNDDPTLALETYPVQVEGDDILVKL